MGFNSAFKGLMLMFRIGGVLPPPPYVSVWLVCGQLFMFPEYQLVAAEWMQLQLIQAVLTFVFVKYGNVVREFAVGRVVFTSFES
jgi:hypothetical protein